MDEFESSAALEVLQKDYNETLKELAGPKAQIVEPFRAEYEELYKALLQSHEAEMRLTKKIQDLNSEISQNAQSVQGAMRAAAEDQQQIATLRRDIETHQTLVEQSLTKEQQAEESIKKLKLEIADLVNKIESQGGMTAEQEATHLSLRAQKDALEKDRDLLRQNIDMLHEVCETTRQKVQEAETVLQTSEDKIAEIKQAVSDKRTEIEMEKLRKEELEQQMKDLRITNDQLQEELNLIKRNIQNEDADLKKTEEDIAEIEREEERLEKKVRQKVDEKAKLQEKLDQEVAKNEKYVKENEQRELALRRKRDEISQHNSEKDRVMKMHEALKSREKALDDERRNLESQRNDLKGEVKDAQDLSESLKRDGDVDRKKIEDLLRERDILNKHVIKADESTKKQIDLVKRQETQAMNMQKDINRWKQDAEEFKKRISDIENQREKYGVELSHASAKYCAAQEELRARETQLAELKTQIQNVQASRNQTKNLYDAVCTDRKVQQKKLAEHNDLIQEMCVSFKNISHTTEALKEEIRDKDNRLLLGHFKYRKVMDINESLRKSTEKATRRVENLMNIVESQKTQMKKLEGTIQEAEQERQAQQKELEGVVGERDILGAQLIRRNEELGLLYEKIKIQQSTLQKGGIQYKERVTEVTRLRAEIRRIKAEVAAKKNQVVSVDQLKRQIHLLSKLLLREETKAKALQEELENPMNVHRWWRLEGSDPATYEMILKVKSLQKLLIAKTEEVVEKDSLIQDKEKLYVQLKNIIARQPGPEVAEQLAWYSQNLKEKTQHMKQMAAELETYHNKVQDLRDETERHTRHFQQIRQAYFDKKRREFAVAPGETAA